MTERLNTSISLPFSLDFPYGFGQPSARALFRQRVEDFRVEEVLGFEPCGEGEHIYLHMRKCGENTAWLAQQIARLAGVKPMDVGYCGLKDRHAITSQWFSVYLPGAKSPNWQALASDTVAVLSASRHRHKLRRGSHRANKFAIFLRALTEPVNKLEQRLATVRQLGVPNYFGEQRFGHDGNNLLLAERLFRGGQALHNRQKRGLVLSAARSYLFNLVLAARVEQQQWRQPLDGEKIAGKTQPDIPTGPLWGRGRSLVTGAARELENRVLQDWQHWREKLEHVGLKQDRRRLILSPLKMTWNESKRDLQLCFSLPPGCFATAVLREICQLDSANGKHC